uniref:Putative disease resistance protein I2C-5, identical n=2 Tax=Solanum TaxID=4107 RepID=Q60D43_SOLDE|nr:Putative disease resistance protein I2C-5, identical [Solanum demissum]
MEIGLAVGGAFFSSALNVLFDRIAPNGDLLKVFQKHTDDVQVFEKLGDILLGLQIVLSDAENKLASNQFVSQWLNKLQSAVDAAENLIEQINYEALRLKVESQLQNQQLSDDFFLNIKKKLEDTIKKLEVLEKQIGRLGLKEHFVSTKQETRTPSTSLVDDSDIFGMQDDIEDLIDRLISEDASGKKLTVVPIVGMGGLGTTTLAKAVYNNERVKNHFVLKAWFCVSEPYDAFRITKGLLQEIGSFDLKADDNLNQLQVKSPVTCRFLKELPMQMEKLINLRHLDISNTSLLKMPPYLSKLKSLQVLVGAKFLVGGWIMEDLGEAQNLYGSVSVVELQNVVDRREAVKAKMREKNHVDWLSLEWSGSSSADNSQTERDILDELRPLP